MTKTKKPVQYISAAILPREAPRYFAKGGFTSSDMKDAERFASVLELQTAMRDAFKAYRITKAEFDSYIHHPVKY